MKDNEHNVDIDKENGTDGTNGSDNVQNTL